MATEPAEKSSYITPNGFAKLKAELDWLWRIERPRITQEVHDAAALGDRSENAGYIYGKKRLREIDRRLRFLSKRVETLIVVSEVPSVQDRIFFGAWVCVEDEEGDECTYRLVGPDEVDPKAGLISIESPMGRAMMGKRVDDEITVRRPVGDKVFTVLSISYTAPA